MIQVEALHKKYGNLVAVDGITFTAQPGKIFGLLGPNGAGKTTTISCISGLLKPTSGRIHVLGQDITTNGREVKRQLGIVPQELALYEDLSATENLKFWGGAYGLRGKQLKQQISEVLAAVGLLDRAKERVKRFSGGMKRRLNLACGIIHRPKVLLLDEPTAGVDPQSRVHLLELVREQVAQGTCVLYTTHYMEEAEDLCDDLAIVDHGHIIAEGTLSDLRSMVAENDVLQLTGTFDPAAVREKLGETEGTEVAHVEPNELRLVVEKASQRLPEILSAVTATGADIREVTLTQPSLENLFIKLTGKRLRE
jgi:linearmycin/streptolysin S transport system ATP-binding protein